MFLPIHKLTKNDIGKMVETKVRMPPYMIIDVCDESVTFSNHIETYVETDKGFDVIMKNNGLKLLSFVRNLESGIIHAVDSNDKNICGVRHSQNSETTNTEYATCEKCIELINK